MNFLNSTKKAAAMLVVAVGLVFAQVVDTAYVPFRVNVDANILAELKNGATVTTSVQKNVAADEDVVLAIPLLKTTDVLHGAQGRQSAPAIICNRNGKITLNLSAQSYKNAEVSLYTVNGKRILRNEASASSAANTMARCNVVAGVYLLSIKGSDAAASVTSRITHRGGSLEINAAFSGNNLASVPQMAKKAADGDWTITVKAVETGYVDSVYTLKLESGTNPNQNISLRASGGGFDVNNCTSATTCKTVTIGTQVWMAENLNIATLSGSWCYGGDNSNCNKYGRLYDWNTATTVCPTGWHLPSRVEWGALMLGVGGVYGVESGNSGWDGAGKLKSTSGWRDDRNGTDEYGFSALPGGARFSEGFDNAGGRGYWWTATEFDDSNAYLLLMYYRNDGVLDAFIDKSDGFSVRCLKD